MAIQFTEVNLQWVEFPVGQGVSSASARTIMGWVRIDSMPPNLAFIHELRASVLASDQSFFVDLQNSTTSLRYGTFSSGGTGTWRAPITTGLHHYAITHDFGNVNNDPLIYIDGVLIAATETSTPSGAFPTGTNSKHIIGHNTTFPNSTSIDGVVYSAPYYNRVLSATEIEQAYWSRLFIPTMLPVFAPMLAGASNLQAFDGATLTADNKIVCHISGATGTPNGAPVGKGDDLLTYE